MAKLCVNLDHIATVRQARKTNEPDPVCAVAFAELAGADGITIHLREDRRHIQDRDLHLIRNIVKTKLNLEMAPIKEMVQIALSVKPDQVTLVPEKREEITTEGGLDVVEYFTSIKEIVRELRAEEITTSLFIDPEKEQIDASKKTEATCIEINTAAYSEAKTTKSVSDEFNNIVWAVDFASEIGIFVNAGHGLTYQNIELIAQIKKIEEFNIGHSVISRSIFTGLTEAVREMKRLIT